MSVQRFARVTDRQLRAWVLRGYPLSRIAALMGCSIDSVSRRVTALWREAESRSHYADPTEEEIRQRCAEIQQRWSEDERYRRAGCCRRPIDISVVRESDLSRPKPGRR